MGNCVEVLLYTCVYYMCVYTRMHYKVKYKEVIRMCFAMETVRFIIIILATKNSANGMQLTSSSERATVGVDFTFTCDTDINALKFTRDSIGECTITGRYPNGTCKFFGSYNASYKYDCSTNTDIYKLTIPSKFDIDTLHGSKWACTPALDPGKSNIIQLYVNVPITKVTITTSPTDINQVSIVVDTNHKFICKTNAGRPSSRIQWYISGTNITNTAISQPDDCKDMCNGKVISTSELLYTGKKLDDGKIIYCTAVNVEGEIVRSENKSIAIWYGPSNVSISPSKQMYTAIETTGSVGPITCIFGDCKPACSVKWNGPNLSDYSLSVLNLNQINRSQAGNYFCTASNNAWSRTSFNISVNVNYGPILVNISPSSQSYVVVEITGSVGPIYCTADCKPACTMTWNGPYIPEGTTAVLNLNNINRNQAGKYQCNATNNVGCHTSVEVDITVNYGPRQTIIAPNTLTYTVTEITGSVGPITCTADCQPTCTMTWNGPNIPVGTMSALTINEINRNQAGNYTCTATNSFGTKTSTAITVNVNYGPTQVNISPAILNYSVAEIDGKVGPIHCSADCKPECIMTWHGPNIPDDTTSVLNFQNINRNKDGKYQCTAANVIGSGTSDMVTIIVNYGPGQVHITPHIDVYTEAETTGNVGPITCTADCKPNCVMTWHGPNIPDFTVYVLTIQKIDRNQAGNYTCTAQNIYGTETSNTVNVIVNFIPTVDVFGNRTYDENSTVLLSCMTQSVPIAEIKWSFEDKIINSSILVSVNKTSQLSTLTIRRVGCFSMGSYNCLAKNFIGEDSKAINIDITCSPRLNDLEYNISTSITVKQQAPLNLTVPIIAYPKPLIYWTHIRSGTILNVTQKTLNVFLTNRVFSTLYIANITTAHYGLYRIYAVNDIGKAENVIHSYEVIPKREPMSPFFVYMVCKSTTATLIWKPGFNGDSSDRFYVMYSEKGEKVITKHLAHNERDEPWVSTVTDLRPAVKYNFSIVAENEFGQSSSRTVVCTTDAAYPLQNVSEFENNENTTMLGAGIGTLVVALLVLAAASFFVIRNKLRSKTTKPGISGEYTDIQRSNPTFTEDYSTFQSEIESKSLHDYSTYEECGQTFDASAYQNIHKMKSGQDKTRTKQVIYDNMEI